MTHILSDFVRVAKIKSMDNNIPEQYQKRPSDLDKRMAKRYNSDGKYIKSSNNSQEATLFHWILFAIGSLVLLIGFISLLAFLFG